MHLSQCNADVNISLETQHIKLLVCLSTCLAYDLCFCSGKSWDGIMGSDWGWVCNKLRCVVSTHLIIKMRRILLFSSYHNLSPFYFLEINDMPKNFSEDLAVVMNRNKKQYNEQWTRKICNSFFTLKIEWIQYFIWIVTIITLHRKKLFLKYKKGTHLTQTPSDH